MASKELVENRAFNESVCTRISHAPGHCCHICTRLIPCLSVLFYIAKEYIYFSVCTGERWHDDAVRCVLSL